MTFLAHQFHLTRPFELPAYHQTYALNAELNLLDAERGIETKLSQFLQDGETPSGFVSGRNTAYDDYDYARIYLALYHAFHDQADLESAQSYAESTKYKAIEQGNIKLQRIADYLYSDIRRTRFPQLDRA